MIVVLTGQTLDLEVFGDRIVFCGCHSQYRNHSTLDEKSKKLVLFNKFAAFKYENGPLIRTGLGYVIPFKTLLLSCQPRVTVTSCVVYKVIMD